VSLRICTIEFLLESASATDRTKMAMRALQAAAATAVGVLGCDVYVGPLGSVIRGLDGEQAHLLGLAVARLGIVRPGGPFAPPDPPVLRTTLCGMDLPSPIGLAAGFDKDAVAVKGLFALGLSAVEIGSVTPKPQSGNARPRVFRLLEDRAIVNRYGFNSAGVEKVKQNLVAYNYGGRGALRTGAVGVNVGKNKETSEGDAVLDYTHAVKELGELADYLVINVSSPNTPGLRALQGKAQLRALLIPVLAARDSLVYKPPVLLKIAPDLSESDKTDAAVALELGLDGLIVSNTTIDRPECLQSEHRDEKGGLSGRPLKEISTAVLRDMYHLTGGKITLIGVGGVESGQDAYDKIRAGANFVQLYSALVYDGPWLILRVKQELAALLERDGYSCVSEAVGADHRSTKFGKYLAQTDG
jgi:dihydroorotate dehydrogenase